MKACVLFLSKEVLHDTVINHRLAKGTQKYNVF